MTKREPFAKAVKVHELNWGILMFDRLCRGHYGPKGPIEAFVEDINAAVEFRVEEEVLKALDLERSNTKDQWAIYEAAAKGCPSCGLLWPDHKDTCGLWVRRSRREGK